MSVKKTVEVEWFGPDVEPVWGQNILYEVTYGEMNVEKITFESWLFHTVSGFESQRIVRWTLLDPLLPDPEPVCKVCGEPLGADDKLDGITIADERVHVICKMMQMEDDRYHLQYYRACRAVLRNRGLLEEE